MLAAGIGLEPFGIWGQLAMKYILCSQGFVHPFSEATNVQ